MYKELNEQELLARPCISFWLKKQILVMNRRDLWDSLNDIECLLRTFRNGYYLSNKDISKQSYWIKQQLPILKQRDRNDVIADLEILYQLAQKRYETILRCPSASVFSEQAVG